MCSFIRFISFGTIHCGSTNDGSHHREERSWVFMPRVLDQFETDCGEFDAESNRSLKIRRSIKNINPRGPIDPTTTELSRLFLCSTPTIDVIRFFSINCENLLSGFFFFPSIMKFLVGFVLLAAISRRVAGLDCHVPWVCTHLFYHSVFQPFHT